VGTAEATIHREVLPSGLGACVHSLPAAQRALWGFFGYLGSSPSAWAYDPSTGDVVYNTKSIQGGLPKITDGSAGVVTVRLDLPRDAAGTGGFSMNGTDSHPIRLPEGSVVLPAACFLKESQKVSLANFRAM
jgi:hypothetical protein